MSSEEAKKLEVLLEMKSKGYNLIDGDSPEIMSMSLGGDIHLNVMLKSLLKNGRYFLMMV